MADAFAAAHGPQLRASGFPEAMYERLRHKLEAEARDASRDARGAERGAADAPESSRLSALSRGVAQVFDAGAVFQVQQLPDGTRRAVCIAEEGLAPEQDVFLVRCSLSRCSRSSAMR